MYKNINAVHKYMSKELLNPEFLEKVEKWTRYNGKKTLMVGNTEITNVGPFEIKRSVSVMEEGMTAKQYLYNAWNDKGNKKIITDLYDATMIHDNSTCANVCTYVLIAERHDQDSTMEELSMRPVELFVYGITKKKELETVELPTLETLKHNFEHKEFTHYHSLTNRKHSNEYEIYSFNSKTDRLRDYALVEMNFSGMDCDEDAQKAIKDVVVPKRYTFEEFEKLREEYREKRYLTILMGQVKRLQTKKETDGLTPEEEKQYCELNSELTGLKPEAFSEEFSKKLSEVIQKSDALIKKITKTRKKK